jgi:hypothetical protein
LIRRGADSERTAGKLAAIRERPVVTLKIAWRIGDDVVPAPSAHFVLDPVRDKRGRVVRADFTWLAESLPDPIDLGRTLADHLELPDEDAEIALYLTDPSRLVQQRALTRGEIDDADRLLRSRRYFAETPEPMPATSQGSDDLNASVWAPPEDRHPAFQPTAEAGTKAYIDPNSVEFGAPEQLPPMAPPQLRDSSTSTQGGRDQPTAANAVSRPVAPTPPETVAATATGKRTEDTAVAIVIRYGWGLPDVVDVKDVQDANIGWDLEFHLRDGRMIPIEVKGSSGSGPFVLTANELNAARAYPDFMLYHVVDLTTPSRTRMRVFRDLGTRLTGDLMGAAGWAVTGWRQLGPVEIPVSQPEGVSPG